MARGKNKMTGFLICLFLMVLISLVNFYLYASDKMRAKNGLYRIPEAVLLSVGFFGGAMGALCGMKLFRHKTKHWYFYLINVIGLLWQLALAGYLLVTGI
jgi:uncharacterized membrane protein YsdA (DUF1294 family)